MYLITSLTAALSAAKLSHAVAFKPSGVIASSSATPSASPTPTPRSGQTIYSGMSVVIFKTEKNECYIEFDNVLGCTGRSELIGDYDDKTGCVPSGIADPIVNDICGNHVTLYPVRESKIYVEQADRDMDVRSGEVYYSNGTSWFGHMLGLSPGCGFSSEGTGIVGPQAFCLPENDGYERASY